ncbi:unnamed protein product [Diamesa tonsa]
MEQRLKASDNRTSSPCVDRNNNNNKSNNNIYCTCTNISIMQLFHEMKQEFPKVPDHIVTQLVTDNCHNRLACVEQLKKETAGQSATTQSYPSQSIHKNNQINLNSMSMMNSRLNGNDNGGRKKTKEISELFENVMTENKNHYKRPTTLALRKAPAPPIGTMNQSQDSLSSASSTSSLVGGSTSSISSNSVSHTYRQHNQPPPQPQQTLPHQAVLMDSSATKYRDDSLNVQLNLTVSPLSGAPPIPPRPPAKPPRHTTQLNVQPELPFTNMLDNVPSTSKGITTTGQRSYTSVNFTLRQPTSILPSPQTPIDIQAGPSSLTYSSSSFDAKQGYQSHLKITVAGNGESCISAVRTKSQNSMGNQSELSQIDTTINLGGNNDSSSHPPITIGTPQQQQQRGFNELSDEELRLVINRQIKQKELLECELTKEREKLDMIRFDIYTLSSPMLTDRELQLLCNEISRLRNVCELLTDEMDDDQYLMVNSNQRQQPPRPPPPIPSALRCLSLHQSPYLSQLPNLPTQQQRIPQLPPSYSDVMRENNNIINRNLSLNGNSQTNVDQQQRRSESQENEDYENGQKWTCNMCTFLNHELMSSCEQCEMPRVTGIKITSSHYRPLNQHNQYQQASPNNTATPPIPLSPIVTPTNDSNNATIQATAM